MPKNMTCEKLIGQGKEEYANIHFSEKQRHFHNTAVYNVPLCQDRKTTKDNVSRFVDVNVLGYLLCIGKEKATAELGLSFLAYNLKRVINTVGDPALIAAVRG